MQTGDFVSSYSSGFWQIIDIKPKIADCDYNGENVKWKKGNIIGQWVILKKAFAPKMKPRIEFEYVDSAWVSPLADSDIEAIRRYFSEHPEYEEKFNNAEIKIQPMITNCWFNLPCEKEEEFNGLLSKLPKEYTMDDFWKKAKKYKKYISNPPSNYLLNFFSYPWNLDKKANIIYHNIELKKTK